MEPPLKKRAPRGCNINSLRGSKNTITIAITNHKSLFTWGFQEGFRVWPGDSVSALLFGVSAMDPVNLTVRKNPKGTHTLDVKDQSSILSGSELSSAM